MWEFGIPRHESQNRILGVSVLVEGFQHPAKLAVCVAGEAALRQGVLTGLPAPSHVRALSVPITPAATFCNVDK